MEGRQEVVRARGDRFLPAPDSGLPLLQPVFWMPAAMPFTVATSAR